MFFSVVRTLGSFSFVQQQLNDTGSQGANVEATPFHGSKDALKKKSLLVTISTVNCIENLPGALNADDLRERGQPEKAPGGRSPAP